MPRTKAATSRQQQDPGSGRQETESESSQEKRLTKAGAARIALAQGIESPKEAVAFIKRRFGIEIGRQHFTTLKSQYRKRDLRRTAGPRSRTRSGARAADGGPDLLDAIESMKPLIDSLGAEKVKKIVDLLS
jgi:hypothetical protein